MVASPVGSPASWTPLLFESAYAVMASAPGRSGPWYVKEHWPFASVMHDPFVVTEPVTENRTVMFGTGVPPASYCSSPNLRLHRRRLTLEERPRSRHRTLRLRRRARPWRR